MKEVPPPLPPCVVAWGDPWGGHQPEGEEGSTEGVEESIEGEGGPTAAAALRGHLGWHLGRPPAGETTEGEEEPTEGEEVSAATSPMEAIVHPGGGADSGT